MTTPTQQQIMDDAVLSAAVYDDVREAVNPINLSVGWYVACLLDILKLQSTFKK